MPHVVQGSVDGCGLAPGPALLLANWTGYLFWLIPVGIAFFKLRTKHAESEDEESRFGWVGYISSLLLLKSFIVIIYGLNDLTTGYEISVTEPSAGIEIMLFLRKLNDRFGWDFRDTMDWARPFDSPEGFSLWFLIFSPGLFCYTASLVTLIKASIGAAIIVDESLVGECFGEAEAFIENNTIAFKVAVVLSLVVSNIVISLVLWRWQQGRFRSIAAIRAVYLVFTVIPLALTVADTYMGIGKPFTCGGCTIHSNYGYYNYGVNWYEENGRQITGGGSSKWYKVQNAFQA